MLFFLFISWVCKKLKLGRCLRCLLFVVMGLFLCYVGFFGKNEGIEDSLIEEPLLMVILVKVMKQSQVSVKGVKTPYSNAGIFSILTFS
jgi:ATP-binding cassette subfamily C (CFTR/MRP) protein 2